MVLRIIAACPEPAADTRVGRCPTSTAEHRIAAPASPVAAVSPISSNASRSYGPPSSAVPTSALILASTSRYRRELLERLRLPFTVESPHVDETALPGEAPSQLVLRLAAAKALAVAKHHPQALVIGSDQTATLDDVASIGKPGNHENAVAQLRAASGRTLRFLTAVSVKRLADGFDEAALIETRVRFRALDDAEIERYLRLERPYDCAGAAKAEGLGITLLEAIEGDDPTAIIGLPLIALTSMLRRAGCSPLAAAQAAASVSPAIPGAFTTTNSPR